MTEISLSKYELIGLLEGNIQNINSELSKLQNGINMLQKQKVIYTAAIKTLKKEAQLEE